VEVRPITNDSDGHLEITWCEPATDKQIAELAKKYKLPTAHIDFLRKSNGAVGCLPFDPWLLQIWGADSMLSRALFYDEILQEEMDMPYMLVFGNNLASEVFMYDRRSQPWSVWRCPSTSLVPEYLIEVASSFDELMNVFGTKQQGAHLEN